MKGGFIGAGNGQSTVWLTRACRMMMPCVPSGAVSDQCVSVTSKVDWAREVERVEVNEVVEAGKSYKSHVL